MHHRIFLYATVELLSTIIKWQAMHAGIIIIELTISDWGCYPVLRKIVQQTQRQYTGIVKQNLGIRSLTYQFMTTEFF